MKPATIILFFALIVGCSEQLPSREHSYATDKGDNASTAIVTNGSVSSTEITNSGQKTMDNIIYQVQLMPALDYLRRKGETVAQSDINDLKKESVAILQIALTDKHKDILGENQLQLPKEDALMYLSDQISQDLQITQNRKDVMPYGVRFDGHVGATNQVKVHLYFKDLKLNQPMKVMLYDRLFGKGLIKFGINEQ